MTQYQIVGKSASAIADGLERAIDDGTLRPEEALPTIRGLAAELGVSPTTVNAAYTQLRAKGRIGGNRRGGSRVIPRAAFPTAAAASMRAGVRDLVIANPDPALLPRVRPFLERTFTEGRLYGDGRVNPQLRAVAAQHFERDGVDASYMLVTSGAADAVEGALLTHLVAGDKVVLEDPVYPPYRELCASLNLNVIPVTVDAFGIVPAELAKAIRAGAKALVVVPRAQNPTGAVIDERRRKALLKELQRAPHLLVIEDDYLGLLTATKLCPLAGKPPRWLFVRSIAKAIAPDLRTALVAGDALTVERMQHRQSLSAGWVSWILQETVAAMLADASVTHDLKVATRAYAARRLGLVKALRKRGVTVADGDGLAVWLHVDDELRVVRALDAEGWAVDAGARYRFRSEPAIRIVTTTLTSDDTERLADAVARSLASGARTTP